MRTTELHSGDLVEVQIRGLRFEAMVLGVSRDRGKVLIDPPKGYGYREATARQIRRRLEGPQERLV